jgi:hypothetical protein
LMTLSSSEAGGSVRHCVPMKVIDLLFNSKGF